MNLKNKIGLLLALLPGIISLAPGQAQENTFVKTTGKKLIEYGWDVPSPQFVRDNITEMEKMPFEGIVFRLPREGGKVFDIENWEKNKAALQGEIDILSSIKWGKFTDNFLAVYTASTMDWYSDSDWEKVLDNTRFCARAAKAARCKGIMFDPEPYGFKPWNYAVQKHAQQYSYEQYAEKVYQRGRQFIRVIEEEMPEAKLLMLYHYRLIYSFSRSTDPAVRHKAISSHSWYGLLLPFLNGMLAESGPQVQFIDGNEHAYYYTQPFDFYQAYWEMRQGASINVPDAFKAKFNNQTRAASALYADHIFGVPDKSYIAKYMSAEAQDAWFEHNVYHGLKSSDEYVWLYSEKMNWWTKKNLPPGIVKAINSAKNKLEKGRDLGFKLDNIFKIAQGRMDQAQNVQKRDATISRLNANHTMQIDGKLDEDIYQQQPWLEKFIGFAQNKTPLTLTAATQAFATYDDKNLYIAFRCDEPSMATQRITGTSLGTNVWDGESIEVSIRKLGQAPNDADASFYHLILNPNNIRWDGVNVGLEADSQPHLRWLTATQKHPTGWTAEVAIPWQEIGVTSPTIGTKLALNLGRQRINDKNENSSWSQFIAGFQEPHNFGNLTLQ